MKNVAKIKDGVVVNLIVCRDDDPASIFGRDFMDCPQDVAIGWTFSNGSWAAPAIEPVPLDVIQQNAQLAAKAIFHGKIKTAVGADDVVDAITTIALNNVDKPALRLLYADFRTAVANIKAARSDTDVQTALDTYTNA